MEQIKSYKGTERRSNIKDRRTDTTLKEYYQGFLVKLMENFSSAKVWFFILPFLVSSIYMGWLIFSQVNFVKHIVEISVKDPNALSAIHSTFKTASDTFNAWCTFNVALAGTIVVVRETFKVSKLKALNSSESSEAEQDIKQVSV